MPRGHRTTRTHGVAPLEQNITINPFPFIGMASDLRKPLPIV
jgi:hypothetical protein